MTRMLAAVPVLPVLDVPEAADRFRALGFAVEVLDRSVAPYAIATRDHVTLHLSGVPAHPQDGDVAVYLYVEDADTLFAEWSAAGVGGRLAAPEDRPWAMREGSYVDPDGLLLRYGSRLG